MVEVRSLRNVGICGEVRRWWYILLRISAGRAKKVRFPRVARTGWSEGAGTSAVWVVLDKVIAVDILA